MTSLQSLRSYIEQRFRAMARDLAQLLGRVSRLESMLSQLGAGRGGQGGDFGGGGYYADPGSVVIASDGSADLDVMEILAAGDLAVGVRTVVNRHSSATIADARLFLSRTRDGAYSVDNQDCPP